MRRRRVWAVAALVLVSVGVWIGPADAEVPLAKTEGGFEFFSEGRVGGFIEGVRGDTLPTQFDPSGNVTHTIGDGGIPIAGLFVKLPMGAIGQGTIEGSRVRSGFLGNILAFGLRRALTERTTVTGFIALWANIESENERKFVPAYTDAREGYVRVQGPAGSLTVGRTLTLFSRGAVEIDFLYGHRYGVGSPAGFDSQGPAGGHVGYGVIAPGFGAGVIYATPSLGGLMLTAGFFDPNRFVGLYWNRTKLGRPEGELTYDHELGSLGKIHLFANGAIQQVYASDSSRSATVWGAGGGGRLEIGVFRLGAAAHTGQGLGFDYAFDGSNAVLEITHSQELRTFRGLYGQTQIVLGKVDVSAGVGATFVKQVSADLMVDPSTGQIPTSVLKQRLGISAGVVYHFSESLHGDIDFFRAEVSWWLGEKQIVNTLNAGLTLTW